jgi:hypothetical protein
MSLHIAGVVIPQCLIIDETTGHQQLDLSVSSAMRLQVAREFGPQRLISEATAWDKLG